MSGINLAILWTECFNKHDNLDILSFNRKNNSWLKIIFLKTLQFLYFRTRYKQFSIQGEPKNVWSNEQYIGSILLKFWRSLYQSIDPTDLNEILGLDEIIHDYFFAFHHHFPFKFDQKKVLQIFLWYHVIFQKKFKNIAKIRCMTIFH